MKNFNFVVSMGSNMTSIYKGGVGVVLHDRSVVVTSLKGKREIALKVGEDALISGLEYRRVIESGQTDFSLAELMLGEYFKKVEIGKKDGVIFLVPLEDMNLINEYKNLAYALGVNNVGVIPSIIATTYGFEIENSKKSYLIADIGINTEVAVINNGRILSGATIYHGGYNIDQKIINLAYEKYGIELSDDSAEKIKNELVTLLPNDIREIKIEGFIKDTTEYSTINITSEDIFGFVVEEYSSIASAVVQLLSSCSNEVNQDIKKHGIYLCGASSKVVGIEKFFNLKLNIESYIYKPTTVNMVGAGQLLDSPIDIQRVLDENGNN